MKKLLAIAILFMLAASGLAEGAGRELSGYYGKDIAAAAKALGGLTYVEGTEFKDNYVSDTLALRGSGGVVACIELKDAPTGDSLCGKIGRAHL